MSDFESKVGLNIDVSQALTSIKTLQRQISDFHSSLAKGSATANLKSLQMQQSLIDTINATGQYSAQMKTVASATQTFTTALEKNKLSMGQYFKYAGGASKSFGRFFRSEMDTIQKVAIERVKDLQTQYIKMGRDANGAIRSIAVRPLALDMDNLATKTQIAAQKQQLLNQLLKQGSTNLLNFGKNTQWAGRQLMVGFTIPLGIFGATAAKTFMQMEEQAIKFKRVYGDTFTATAETDAMIKQIQTLASEFTKYGVAVEKTMEQAATAAAAGKMGADLLAQVTEATRLSVLGNVEQQKALETTISLSNAFGTSADQLRGKINFLNAVENQTVTSIEDLTIAIPKAAPVIQQLGGEVEDLTFFLTAMREGGINASEGANALKSGLASLINPTQKASDFMAKFGINIKSIVEGNKGDVKGLVVDFAKALDTLDPLNRARAIEQLFGKFQFSRLSTLFQNVIKDGSQAARVLELTKQSSAELGILAQRELNRISASPMYKFQKAVADFKKELAPVGEEFIKAVTPIIQFGTDMLKAFNSLDGGVKQFIVNTTGLIAGIGPIFLMTFGLLANGVANIIKGFTFVKTVFNKTSSASTILGETTDYMTQQQLEAASVAASLEQVHNKLTQAFTVEATAVGKLAAAYQKAISAQNAFTGPRPVASAGRRPKKYADGVFSVPGPKGAGDIIPAMLSPGEAVIPAKMASRYSGFITGMISGKIPGFNKGKVGGSNPVPKPPRKPKTLADAISSIASDQPRYLTDQTRGLMHPDFANEQQIVRDAFAAQGFDIDGKDKAYQTYSQAHAAHIGSSNSGRAVTVDTKNGKLSRWIKNWSAKQITPQLGLVNKYIQDISDPDMERKTNDPKQKGKKVFVYKKFMQEDNIKRVAKALKIPVGDVRKHAMHLFTGSEALTPQQTAVLGKIAETHRDSVKITDKMGQNSRRKAQAEIAKVSAVSSVASRRVSLANDPSGFFLGRGKYKENEAKQKAYAASQEQKLKAAADKSTRAEVMARNDETAASKQASKTAKAKTAAAKKEEKTTKKPSSNKPVKPAQSRVAPVPKVTTSEDLGEGLRRVVSTDANGKQKETYYQQGRRGALSATAAQAMLAARSGATASPGGRVKRFLTGTTGRVAGGSMIGSMIARSVGGEGAEGLASIFDIVGTAALAKGMFPEKPLGPDGKKVPSRIGTAIKGSTIAKKITPYLDDFAKALKVAAPSILRVLGPVGLVVTGGTIAFDILTEKARKQSEIAGALLDTVLVTKDKLEGINNFFGTEAKLSGIRTAGPVGIGETQTSASLAEQFRASEEFQKTYKPFVDKIIEGSGSDITLALNSLAVELMASGLDKDVVQIIIDAIKQEAKRTDLVIDVKSLSLDTKGGLEQLRKGIASAIADYKSKVSEFDPFGFNANSLKLSLQEVTNFLNGLGTAYQSTAVSSEDFNKQYDLFIQKVNTLSSKSDKLKFLNDSLKLLAPEIAALTEGIYNLDSAALLVKLTLAGIGISKEAANILRVNDPDDVKAFYEAAEKAFKAQDRRLKSLKSKQEQLTKTQEQLEQKESDINDKYDERITALERINDLQKQIAEKQKSQLDLADALSRGDVFGAARAVQDIRAKEAQYAIEQQKQALEDARAKETGAVQDKIGGIQKQIQNIDSQILQIKNANITIDTYLAPDDYKADYTLPEITEADTRPGVPKGQGLKVLKDEKGKQYFPVNLMDQYLNYPWNVTTKKDFVFPDMNGKKWKVTSSKDLGNDGIPDRAYVTPVIEKAAGGYISGPGSGTSDSIPARLSNGEYVIRAKAVKALGADTLDRLNHAEKFAKGGMVRGYAPGGPVVKKDTSYSDPGLDWFNSFIQSLLGGGNPSNFMQNDYTKNLYLQSYNDAAAQLFNPADPLTYLNFLPFGGVKGGKTILDALKVGGKNLGKFKPISKPFIKTDIPVGKNGTSTIPSYAINKEKQSFAFQGYKQNMSYLSKKGITVVPTTPEGLLEAALKINPRDKKLQAMLKNFQEDKFGKAEKELLVQMQAATSIGETGLPLQFHDTDGFALLLSSLTGNKAATSIINSKVPSLLDMIEQNRLHYKSGRVVDRETTMSAVPSTVPVTRSSKYPIQFDAQGNVVFYPGGNYKDYVYSRTTQHFALEDEVKSHLQGRWDPSKEQVVVTRLDSMIKENGLPDSMIPADTYWSRDIGEPLVIPKGSFSIIQPYRSPAKYKKDLLARGLIKPGETPPFVTVDPKTNEVLRLFKKEYSLSDMESVVGHRLKDRDLEFLNADRISEMISKQSIQRAKELIGIKTQHFGLTSEGSLSGTHWWEPSRQEQIAGLSKDLGVMSVPHGQTPSAWNEGSMYRTWHNSEVADDITGKSFVRSSSDTLAQIRMAARKGHFKTEKILSPRFIENARRRGDLGWNDGPEVANGGLVKFAKGGMVGKPKTGSTASIYSDDKSVDMSDGNVIGHGLNFVMNSIYEMLFGKWAVKTKQGTPTAPDLEDMGTMAMNIVPIPGMKGFKSAQLAAKGFMQTGTVAGAKAAQSGVKALDSFKLASPLTRKGVEIGQNATHIPTQSEYYLKAYKGDTAIARPFQGINEPLAYWLSQRLGSDVVPYEFLQFGKGVTGDIGPFGMVKDTATLVASKMNPNLVPGLVGIHGSVLMEKMFLNAYKQGGPEALQKAIQEYLGSIQRYADNTSPLNTLLGNADIHGLNVMYDTASKAITQLDFGHASLFTDLLSGQFSKLPTKFSYLDDFYSKNPLEIPTPGDLGYDVLRLEQGLQYFLRNNIREIPELSQIMSNIGASKTIMNPNNFLEGLSGLYKSGDPLESFAKEAAGGSRSLEKWLTTMLLKDVQGNSGKVNMSKSFAKVVEDMTSFIPKLLEKLPKTPNWFNIDKVAPRKPLGEQGVVGKSPFITHLAKGGMVGIPKFKNGGMFRTSYAQGGLAMLHDKEFVMNPGAVKEYGVDKLKAMNNGTYNSGSVYNSYGVNINVDGSNSNANDIARTVIKEIKRLDSQNIRSTKV